MKQGGVLSPTLFSVYVNELLDNMQNSGYGCSIGDKFVGCVSYADDIIILCASLYGLKQMIKICESYALEYQIKFNGNKSKLMIFSRDKSIVQVEIKVFNEVVEIVESMNYLGFKMSSGIEDSYLGAIIKDFNVKFNIFMGDFQGIKSKLKCELFSTYCTSYYGSNLCDFHRLDSLEVQWRKALRRIWILPYRAHCNLLYNVCKLNSPKVLFLTRFMRYFLTNVASSNSVVKYIFQSATRENSRLGNNLRYILHKVNLNVRDMTINEWNYNDIYNLITDNWKNNFMEEDIRISEQILDLIEKRDSLEPWILNRGEIQNVIDMLATT